MVGVLVFAGFGSDVMDELAFLREKARLLERIVELQGELLAKSKDAPVYTPVWYYPYVASSDEMNKPDIYGQGATWAGGAATSGYAHTVHVTGAGK
jgi:hypothetical protein